MAQDQDTLLVRLNKQPVELYKILKFEGIAGSGAEAKRIIDDECVLVNNQLETRRRRKIHHDDIIHIGDVRLLIEVEDAGTAQDAMDDKTMEDEAMEDE